MCVVSCVCLAATVDYKSSEFKWPTFGGEPVEYVKFGDATSKPIFDIDYLHGLNTAWNTDEKEQVAEPLRTRMLRWLRKLLWQKKLQISLGEEVAA